ncbi:signal recognition particle-docking protein FtsY [Natronoglomus mannanivorans]|uniref:Signal recognition particle receptor FtsY n=1 Tax=Natronoglomus mannanivorans TaxID=2979990 RepID=A0AAP2Z0L0_9EURY|nr:signal recognition particle-docking protein FtsY [Halobacteria archaeon AArc-xg1-1]
MFDSLKDKLGSFRKDVEETAEEKAEPVDEEELDDDEVLADDGSVTEPETDADGPDYGFEADADATEDAANASADVETDTASEPAPDSAPAPHPDPESESEPTPAAASQPESTPDDSAPSVDAAVGGEETELEDGDVETDAESESESESELELEEDSDESEADTDTDADDDGSNSSSTGFGRKAKSLVRGKFVIEEEDLEEPLEELELALLSSDVEMGVAEEILDNIRDELVGETRKFTESTGGVVEEALKEAIRDVISVGQFDFDERVAIADKPLVIIFTGVNGVGKTTSIAKLSRYLEERGFSSVMANGDTYRAGANEQIREHAEALDTKLIAHEQGGDPAAVLYDAVEYAEANDVDVVLGDTAGRLHTDEGLMDQLEKIDRVVDPDMAIFVDEAVAGQDAVNRAREFNEAAPFDGAILTKADADSNGGAAISVAQVTGQPILFLGVGQGYDDIERFDPDRMVDRLLEEEDEE